MFLELRHVLVFISWTAFIDCQIVPFIVGGKNAKIENFPYSVFMARRCFEVNGDKGLPWVCGASIVNELMILTAAHCVGGCSHERRVSVFSGHIRKWKGFKSTVETISIHPMFTVVTKGYDIALGKLKTPLIFGKNVKRIALMKQPPYFERAKVAGWGLYKVSTIYILYSRKKVDN